jgi:hypothetical protein
MHAQYARLRETTRVCARHTPNESVANKNSVAAATRDANAARMRAIWAAQYQSEAEESEKEEAAARAAAAEEAAQAEEKVLFDLLDRIANEAALDADAAQEEARKEERAAKQLMREEGERAAAQLGAAVYAAGRKEREKKYRQMLRQQVHEYKLRGATIKAKDGYPDVPAKAGDETLGWVESIRDITQYRRLQRIKAERAAEKRAKPVEKEGQVEPPAAPVPPPAVPPAAVPLPRRMKMRSPSSTSLRGMQQRPKQKRPSRRKKRPKGNRKRKRPKRESGRRTGI